MSFVRIDEFRDLGEQRLECGGREQCGTASRNLWHGAPTGRDFPLHTDRIATNAAARSMSIVLIS